MEKNRNCSVDIFRYICAIMVVAIHTHPLEDISPQLSWIFTGVISRMAVPIFFAIAGYYYIQKLVDSNPPRFINTSRGC